MRALVVTAAVVLLLAVLGCGVADAAATDASELTCSPASVVPGQNISCTIRGRDVTHETTRAYPSDFAVRVEAEASDVQVSPIQATADETLVAFTVSSSRGTYLNIGVTAASNGLPVRGSGYQAMVYATPPTSLGALTCDQASLPLRQFVTCTVPATGENGVPAVVALRDVYFSEDHGDGTFDLVSGFGAFTFKFTAPNSPSTKYAAFVIRVALSGSLADPRNISLPVRFPSEAPTARTTLVCTDADYSHCTVNAANAAGPVQFNVADYTLAFEQQDTSSGPWQASTLMVGSWTPATSAQLASVGNLRVDQRELKDVLTVRTHVRLTATGEEVSGSPHTFTSGIPPTANDVTVRRCRQTYLVAGRATTCYVTVAAGVAASPRFMTAAVVEGAGVVGPLSYISGNDTGIAGFENTRAVQFNFTAAADIEERMDVVLSVTVQGDEAVRSPLRLVVFPKSLGDEVDAASNKRQPVIALGLCFFGSAYILGLVAFFKRNQRLRRVKANRRAKELAKQEQEDREMRERALTQNQSFGGARYRGGNLVKPAVAPVGSTVRDVEQGKVHVRAIEDHERSAAEENMPKAAP